MTALISDAASTTPTSGSGANHVRINLLGRFQMIAGGREVTLAASAQRLLAFLALRARPQTRLLVGGTLWPDKPDARACANLRSSIWRARFAGGEPLVTTQGNLVALARHITLDVTEMEEVGWTIVEGGDVPLLRSTRQLFYDDLLPGWYDEWVNEERQRLHQLRAHFLSAMAEHLLAHGRRAEAVDAAMRLATMDHESAHASDLIARARHPAPSAGRAGA